MKMKFTSAKSLVVLMAAYSGSLKVVDADTLDELTETTGTKPPFNCSNNAALFELGGFNVDATEYSGNGLAMIEALWRKGIPNANSPTKTDIQPSQDFDLTVPVVGDDDYFAFDIKDGIFRGVGVNGTSLTDDSELSEDEGLWVHFGGAKVYEISFGVRAFLGPDAGADKVHFEEGQIRLYKNGMLVGAPFSFVANDAAVDGQESYSLICAESFDSVAFITRNHNSFSDATTEDHDYFLEYVDICCPLDASIKGDPHIETWSGVKYDFHGVCDLVLLQNPDFKEGLGMDIHVRTKQIKQFSYVSSAVLRIGDDTLEVMGDLHENLYWLNKKANGNLDEGISGYHISYQRVNSKQHEFIVDLGNNESIVMRTFKKFVRVNFRGATVESFGTSRGLLGSYGSGRMIGRDNNRVIEDTDEFGQEWQVLPDDGMLFHNVEGPQAPAKCEVPQASNLRRRLAESSISEEEAEFACSRVNPADFDTCVFDVMATGDRDVVGAY